MHHRHHHRHQHVIKYWSNDTRLRTWCMKLRSAPKTTTKNVNHTSFCFLVYWSYDISFWNLEFNATNLNGNKLIETNEEEKKVNCCFSFCVHFIQFNWIEYGVVFHGFQSLNPFECDIWFSGTKINLKKLVQIHRWTFIVIKWNNTLVLLVLLLRSFIFGGDEI